MKLNLSSISVMSAELINGKIEIVRREQSKLAYASGEPVPDNVTKETYECVEGEIKLVTTKVGKIFPAKLIPERLEFD